MDPSQQLRHQCRGADKDQRTRPKARLFPDPLEVSPIVGGEAHSAYCTRSQPGADDCDDTRYAEQLLGEQVDDVRKCHRQSHLGQARVAEEGQDGPEQAPTGDTQHDPAEKGRGEMRHTGGEVRAFSVSVATRTEKSTMAAASLSRLSPSSSRVRRAGAPTSRKIATTAAGSVVATIAPTNNATVSGIPAAKDRLKPIAAAAANTATIAKVRIGAQSGAISRGSIVSAA